MELSTLKDAFVKISKMQKLSTSKTQVLIDEVLREIETFIAKIQSTDNATDPTDDDSLYEELTTKLNEIYPVEQLEASQKDLNLALNKYTELLEKNFYSDISKAYRPMEFDSSAMNLIITNHFYKQGLFEVGDAFIQEAMEDQSAIEAAKVAALRASFLELFQISEALKSGSLEPALDWVDKHRETLRDNGSSLELELRRIQFVEILKKGSIKETGALTYAKKYLAPLAFEHTVEVPKTFVLILWAGKLDKSPYRSLDIISHKHAHLNKVNNVLKQQFCAHLGQPYESPLNLVVNAGVDGLPTLLKYVKLLSDDGMQELQKMEQLPVPIELGKGFHFHSMFVCPILKEEVRGGDDNSPMLMTCGHVVSTQAVGKLSDGGNHRFKCPFCRSEVNVDRCKQLHL